MRRGAPLVCVLLAACVAVGAARSARADTSVIPDTPDLPWTDPNHQSAFEVLASRIASQIAGREARVYCNGQNDWDILRAKYSFTEWWWGYVPRPSHYWIATRTWVETSPAMQLAPIGCEKLWNFAKAAEKPTKCEASKTTTTSQTVTVRYKKRIATNVVRRAKVDGVFVKRRVNVYRMVWRTRQEQRASTTTVPLGRVPCYAPAASGTTVAAPPGGDAEYSAYAFSLALLAHESIHLRDSKAGVSIDLVATRELAESRAECLGMQNIHRVAEALGATPDDARAIAEYYATRYYPTRRTSPAPEYWSPACVPGGALDETPGDGIWP